LSTLLLIDLPAVCAALLALLACGTIGNWLVLRKESMSGDAIAHAVLPGLVTGYLVAGRHSVAAMFVGAACAGLAAILVSRWIGRSARLEPGASLGIAFTAFFALGVALLETQDARQVDLDPGCVLFGAIETMFFVPPDAGPWYAGLPREFWTLGLAAAVSIAFSILCAKELAASAFDPLHARVSTSAPRALDSVLLFIASLAIVASFEAVGSLLVIALIACPSLIAAPFARGIVSRFAIGLSAGGALTIAGYALAAHAPSILGTETALNAAGMIAVLLALAVPAAHGLRALVSRRPA
jgi:manganese/zinc/iron transport system permease protein